MKEPQAFQENQATDPNLENGEDIKAIIFQYLRYWPWFLASVLVFVIGAFIYLRYSTSIYQTTAKVKVLDENDDGGLDLSGLSGSRTLFNMTKVNLENEMQIFKSRRILEQVVKSLDFNTTYQSKGTIKSFLVFGPDAPFHVNWIPDSTQQEVGNSPSIQLASLGNNEFKLISESIGEQMGRFGDTLQYGDFTLLITDKRVGEDPKPIANMSFWHTAMNHKVKNLAQQISLEPVGDKSHVLQLGIKGANQELNKAILDRLIQVFNQDGIEDKRLVSKRTQDFVERRLVFLEGELDTVESGLVNFKRDNNVVTVESSAEQLFGKEAGAEQKRYEMETQLLVARDFQETLQNQSAFDLLPANIGIDNENVNALTQQFNSLVTERQRYLVSGTEENPMVVNLNQQINQLRGNLNGSVNAYIRSLETALRSIRQRESVSAGQLGSIPEKEKQIRDITRQREIKERLYLFLLQRREEAALSYAITSPVIKVVDWAYTQPQPVAPKKQIILLGALVLGLLLPFGILYVLFLLDTKIHHKNQVKRLLPQIPIVGEVPTLLKTSDRLIQKNDHSVLAEAFRILRTNLNFFVERDQKGGKVVFTTSTTKGEGKTFVAINLAISIASTGKKVLLLGCDLRNPQLHSYINLKKNLPGTTDYLYRKDISLAELVQKNAFEHANLDLVLSGEIPPNPAELLLNGRFESLLDEARQNYDYIVVDTAPTILVTDTLLIAEHADATLYMIRANYTDSKLTQHIEDLQRNEKIKNMGLVLNDVKADGAYGYNYGYGYGYHAEEVTKKKKWGLF
ncbi:tyrosine-protein kinase [Mesonia sp. HuA40]|uniref:GumC family protein n=1 Tax=Mesonia sp. HuA40 TaxID=2602761 RepID=UPI0011CABD10|nr:tyrosine-protein kinase [Mesonia sp. HuA40]TXK71645.1 polysaccharide biosynthesis tyrosine autokinase [Mesonia sp. HuA40]